MSGFQGSSGSHSGMRGRSRSRSPRKVDSRLEALLGSQAGLQPGGDGMVSTTFELPSPKLGQLLGYKGLTIQKIKEVAAVTRLHIHDKEKAKFQASVLIEVAGQVESVSHCMHLLEALCNGDQTEIGHLTTYLNVDPTVIGKLMGHKGQTVKEMTDVTGCYIEIQQYHEQGVVDGQPRLFFAGQQDNVEAAVDLAKRFIAAPGSRLDAVLGYGATAAASAAAHTSHPPPAASHSSSQLQSHRYQAPAPAKQQDGGGNVLGAVAALIGALAQPSRAAPPGQGYSAGGNGAMVPEVVTPEPGAPIEERIMEVPARFKGHLLGLHGSTIETIRQTSGVIKCHMQEKRDVDRWGPIHVQILGTHECVEACAKLINGVLVGDHTGIGHSTTLVNIDPSVVGKIMGHKGQTIKELTETTHCYIEIQQYPEQGVTDNQPRLFIAGPPQAVENAVALIERFIAAPGSRLETVLGPGELSRPAAAPQPANDSNATSFAALSSALAALAQATTAGSRNAGSHAHAAPASSGASANSTASVLAALAAAAGASRSTERSAPLESNGLEERIIEVPTSKKGHLLGLRGQTIETVRQMSGVKKCHMMDKNGQGSWGGTIPIQILGTYSSVERCIEMINDIVAGDHSSIGHASDHIPVDQSKVNTLMGHRGQTCTLLKDLTGCYLDIQQGPQAGVPSGEARVFMAGPPENVQRAKSVLTAFLSLMDTLQVPANGPSGPLGGMGSSGAGGIVDLLKGLTGG
mmetsp:Transcript_110288/g.351773  ORF Transcript_110288/g.351773 Transcript_110288/m.351773 type:complete len:745 (-) Transcript_110288:156-2390(-)